MAPLLIGGRRDKVVSNSSREWALRTDDRGGTRVEHLYDVGLLASPEGGDGRGQRVLVATLVDGGDDVVGLAGVEAGGDLVDGFAKLAAHGVPERDLGLRAGRRRQHRGAGGRKKRSS